MVFFNRKGQFCLGSPSFHAPLTEYELLRKERKSIQLNMQFLDFKIREMEKEIKEMKSRQFFYEIQYESNAELLGKISKTNV